MIAVRINQVELFIFCKKTKHEDSLYLEAVFFDNFIRG